MPCDTRLRNGQTIKDRIAEVQKTVEVVDKGLASGRIKAIVSKDGAVAFQGLSDEDRNRVTDNCCYRRILAKGSALARMKIAAAEQLAGRSVSKQMVAQGAHSHDGGATFHSHKG